MTVNRGIHRAVARLLVATGTILAISLVALLPALCRCSAFDARLLKTRKAGELLSRCRHAASQSSKRLAAANSDTASQAASMSAQSAARTR